jgi:integrase
VTAQRPGEVAALDWSEIQEDEDGAWWTIPANKAKNGLAHRVPLSPVALEIIHSLPQREAGPVFDSLKFPGKGIERHSMSMALVRARETMKIDRCTPHDLRRTAATQMAILGVNPFTIGKILNHQERGVTKIYTRASYDAEKREALEAWGSKLQDTIAGKKSKIVKIAQGQGK